MSNINESRIIFTTDALGKPITNSAGESFWDLQQYSELLVRVGILTPNEARRLKGLDPSNDPDADKLKAKTGNHWLDR